jgi:hypothetical protein
MPTTVHRPPKIIVFNTKVNGRQAYKVRRQLQYYKIGVALFSEIHLKPNRKFYIPNYDFYLRLAMKIGAKAKLPLQLRKASLTFVSTYLLTYQQK